MKEKKRKRIIADIPVDVHKALKMHAAMRYISMQKYVAQAIIEKVATDNTYLR